MTQAGGPAAINGFLYQILNHLAWLKNVHIGEVIAENGKSEDAFMVLEPRNGGDARLENGMTYVVEQYKVRSNRTWAVKSIIEGVLPDLRKSIPNFTGAKCAYIFVTDGRQGDAVQYKKFKEFLDYLQNCTLPSDIDHQPLVIFGNDFPKTRKELFDYIVAQTRTGSVTSQQESEDLKVLELLQNFQMKFEYSVEDRIQEVESFLRQFVPNLGDEVDIRYRLVGQLMEMLSNGEVRLDSLAVDAILREAGLNPDRIRRLVILNEVMVPLVNEEVERMKYIPAKDVRRSPIWPEDKSVLVISGDSGNGKTWQLIKTILGLREINKLSIIVRQAGTAEQTLFRASRLVWQAGLGETSEKSLESLALHYKDMRPGGFVDWLTIGIDDVRDAKTAEDYINQPWKRWGMRLVVTVPKSVVRSLKEEMPAHVHFHEASKFSVEEIDTFLKAYGKNWTDLPADLQKILRVPILAGIYADLEYGNFQSAPNTEYEIFERFWGRMQSKASSGDPGVLLALAGRVIDEQTYPLSRYQWNQVGLTDDVLARLDTVGWLQCHSDGDVYFSHDRLLNWAAAKKIGHLLKVHQWNWGHISKFLEQCALPRWGESKRLDYLPMDVVWLLLADDRNLIGLKSLLEFFERSQAFGSYAADLYKYLLPTLGYRVVPLLMIRLEKIVAQEQEEYLAKLISEAMSKIAAQENINLAAEVGRLIYSNSLLSQQVGIAVLKIKPVIVLVDRLWELHCLRSLDLQSENGISHVSHYEDCHAALKACVRQHPQWLMDKINNLELNFQFFPELGYLISSLDHPLAVKIWFKNKAMLLEKMPKDRRRSLVYCISRFNDISEINFLTNCLVEKSDYVDGAALAALAKLDPDALLKNIDAGVGFGFVLFCNQWVPDLLHVRPEATRRKLLELAMTDKEKSRILKQALLKYVDEFDIPLLEFFLENFKNKINDNLIDACNGDSMWISVYLSFFNKITKPELLDFMIRYSVVGLEGALVRVAVERIGRFEGGHDYVLEDIRLFLIRLAGYGISELILAELSSDFFRRRYAGLEAAAIGGDVVISVLEKIAGNKVAWSADGTTASEAMRENYHAMVALALLGAREKIIDAIWLSGYPALPIDFMSLLGGARPVPKVMIQRAFEVFANIKNAERGEIVCALAVAWVSADKDFIVPIRNALKYPEVLSVGFVYVCMALQELGDDSDDFINYASNLLRDEKTRAYGCRALLSIPEKGIKYLTLYLESIPFERWQPFDVEVVRSIFKFERSRDFALRISIKYCLELPDAIFLPLDVVCENAVPEVRDLIVEMAFRLDYISTAKTMSAIKALVKIAPDRATDAILKHLRKSENSEYELCALFVRIDPENAVEVFLNLIIDLDRSGVKRENIRAAAGRAIRWLGKDLVDFKLAGFFESSNRKERAIAVDLAGWLPPYRLDAQLEVLIRDENEDLVRGSFFDAMRRRNSEKNLYVLYDDFEVAETKMRWALLYTIMQAGDPILLADRNDPLWIGGILEGAPCMYMRYADAEIGRRIKKIPLGLTQNDFS